MRVFLHTQTKGENDLINEMRDFARIPVVGECIALGVSGDWYQVQLVVHTPFPCDCDAEVYALKIDRLEIMKKTFNIK